MAERPSTRRGPRGAGSDTRGAVLAAARARFAAHGYEATRLRDVADDAGVDVALVSYHFGSKDGLFAAALSLPLNPAQLVAELAGGGVDGLGERLVRRLVALLDQRAGDGFVALVRSAATNERAAELLRDFVEHEVLAPLAAAIDADRPRAAGGAVRLAARRDRAGPAGDRRPPARAGGPGHAGGGGRPDAPALPGGAAHLTT